MSVSVLLMGIVGPITAGTLTSTASAWHYGPGCSVVIRGCLREHVELTFWLHFPLAPRLKSWTVPRVEPCIGHTKCAHRVQSQEGFHSSEHLEENISGVWC